MTSIRKIHATMCPDSSGPISVRALAGEHLWSSNNSKTRVSISAFVRRHQDSHSRQFRFLFQNAYLLSAFTFSLPVPFLPDPKIAIGHKPALFPRARELGAMLREEYDVSTLCEVFSEEVRTEIIKAWKGTTSPSESIGAGAGSPPAAIGSGLYTLNTIMQRRRTESHVFRERGRWEFDSDVYANKGILMTELDPGIGGGNLEIYSTHMLSGNDIPNYYNDVAGALGFDTVDHGLRLRNSRLRQVKELAEFIRKNNNPENVVIVVGDFNIKRHDPAFPVTDQPYAEMVKILRPLGLVDLWAWRRPNTSGKTSNFEVRREQICQRSSDNNKFCKEVPGRESDFAGQPGETLDYMFVQKPLSQHEITVDFSKPRRRYDIRDRDAPKFNKIEVLSDHLGLHTTLIVAKSN